MFMKQVRSKCNNAFRIILMYVVFKLQILNWVIIALNYLQYFFEMISEGWLLVVKMSFEQVTKCSVQNSVFGVAAEWRSSCKVAKM